jgi:hypothetical protein
MGGLLVTTKVGEWGHMPWRERGLELDLPSVDLQNAIVVVTGRWPVSYLALGCWRPI